MSDRAGRREISSPPSVVLPGPSQPPWRVSLRSSAPSRWIMSPSEAEGKCFYLQTDMKCNMSAAFLPYSLLLGGEDAVPIGRRGIDLELGDVPPIKIVDRC